MVLCLPPTAVGRNDFDTVTKSAREAGCVSTQKFTEFAPLPWLIDSGSQICVCKDPVTVEREIYQLSPTAAVMRGRPNQMIYFFFFFSNPFWSNWLVDRGLCLVRERSVIELK